MDGYSSEWNDSISRAQVNGGVLGSRDMLFKELINVDVDKVL